MPRAGSNAPAFRRAECDGAHGHPSRLRSNALGLCSCSSRGGVYKCSGARRIWLSRPSENGFTARRYDCGPFRSNSNCGLGGASGCFISRSASIGDCFLAGCDTGRTVEMVVPANRHAWLSGGSVDIFAGVSSYRTFVERLDRCRGSRSRYDRTDDTCAGGCAGGLGLLAHRYQAQPKIGERSEMKQIVDRNIYPRKGATWKELVAPRKIERTGIPASGV